MAEGTNTTVIAATIVQLAQLAVIAYAIGSVRAYLIHWLDTRTGPLFPRRTPEQMVIDSERLA